MAVIIICIINEWKCNEIMQYMCNVNKSMLIMSMKWKYLIMSMYEMKICQYLINENND